jgi:hypothetical protein
VLQNFLVTIRQLAVLLVTGWRPGPASAGRWSLYRSLVLAGLWPLFLLIQAINWAGLLLDELLFADYRRVRVREPLFIIGVPRSGTTFLHRLIAGDEKRFTTTTLWECLFAPSITQRYIWTAVARLDGWLGRPLGRALSWLERRVLGGLDDIHKTGLTAPEEDYLALMPVLGCFLIVLAFPHQGFWRLCYFDRELSPAEQDRLLDFYHRLVQRHLWFHGVHRTFLSKNPSFTPMLEGLARRFPDACFVGCLRNPTAAVPSQVNSMMVGARLLDRQADTAWWRDRLSAMLVFYYRHLLDALPALAEQRRQLVTMEELVADPQAVVESLYRRFGWRPGAAALESLRRQAEAAKGYRSGHQYSLEGLAITAGDLNRDFGFVYDHFGFPRPGEAA